MSCMKKLVLSEPVIDLLDSKSILTSNCCVNVSMLEEFSVVRHYVRYSVQLDLYF